MVKGKKCTYIDTFLYPQSASIKVLTLTYIRT